MTNSFFDEDDPFGLPPAPGGNAPPEYTVSEISQKLKRAVEEEFSFVRVRGEISKVTVAKSGHLYTSLKDADAVLDAICWKGTLSRLGIKPEEGMEVVCTGRLTTYPGRSNYQMIIETMELAGQGALLKMLEERKKKLAAEGIFDPARKKPIPFLPQKIGVITSPTGAVIRDIMHRLNDRFPRPVLLWPVIVQGQTAATSVIAAIKGFNALPPSHRPDVIIVARGGGSLEDLMPFNDEALVRAVAASEIPVISAVGHETDTTLIDYAADLRAPTPSAAAEKAVPVRMELLSSVLDLQRRMVTATSRFLKQHKIHLEGLARGLGDPRRLLETTSQRLDHLSSRLDLGLSAWLQKRAAMLETLAARLAPHILKTRIINTRKTLFQMEERLAHAIQKVREKNAIHLKHISSLLESLSFERVLERGYSVVFDDTGEILSSRAETKENQKIRIRFKDGEDKAIIQKKSG